ncbi:hypothetical protein ABZX98_00705 [Streptomyces sp. NPDC002992]|uniref:hypothetical protein n=1 Tax=Streptomyces sp. NPDC002992 TaxID=3154273 RepID=UPI0033B7DCF1
MGKTFPTQEADEPVEPRDGTIRVHEHVFRRALDGKQAPSVFLVRTPGPVDGSRGLVPCTPEASRRWARAAVAYITAVDEVTDALWAARRRAASVPRWRTFAARRALRDWEETRQRYERVMREAGEAYEPVGREIRQAIQAERDKAAERARELARREEEARRRRARLAERAIWGRAVVTEPGWRAVCVFRHDVPRGEAPDTASPEESPHLDLAGLRRALRELDLPHVLWDGPALAETERELEGVSFGRWWRELFHEDYRTLTERPPSGEYPGGGSSSGGSSSGGSGRRGNPSGGTGTSGSGGFSGGFSCVGGF